MKIKVALLTLAVSSSALFAQPKGDLLDGISEARTGTQSGDKAVRIEVIEKGKVVGKMELREGPLMIKVISGEKVHYYYTGDK